MADKKIDKIAPKGISGFVTRSRRQFPIGDETVPITVVNKKDGTVDKEKTRELAGNNSLLRDSLRNERILIGTALNRIVKMFASPSEKNVLNTAKKLQKMKKGGKVVKKPSTVKRSPNGKSKQPIKKATRTTQKATRRSKG